VARLARALVDELPGRVVLLGRHTGAVLDDEVAMLPSTPFMYRQYHAWMQIAAPRATRRRHLQMVHYTNAAAPLLGRRPYVLTVHDLSVLVMPRAHPLPRLMTVPISVRAILGARRIIVPSQATAAELQRLLRVDPRRIVVVPHAPPPPEDADDTGDALADLGVRPQGYVIALGTIEPRKNHVRLIDAWETLVRRGYDLDLVITGAVGWHAQPVLRRIAASPFHDRIHRTDYLPGSRLRQLMAGSAAACYLSLYEGYGLPIIEAMAAGAPVVTSNLSSMPEVAGGAAVLVDPRSPSGIAHGIERALRERKFLVASGLARARARSWADVARETAVVYGEALEG
jgi:glycosyltransferase involved in cell wall biosynthesis